MSENLLTDCFSQTAVDFIREVACNCGCGVCEKPILVHKFIMTDSTPAFDPNSQAAPVGCTHWSIYEPSYHNYNWDSGRIKNGQFVESDCITPAASFHTTLKGYTFLLEFWAWCVPDGAC